ncbi:response regulator transcription factor, partial [Candidatus Aerophobetes bacterium]|nr:response regulator transcription factor [Candidatus Aerophobetes bacterium]
YITKPFSVKELVARVKAVLRRKGEGAEQEKDEEKINIGGILQIDEKKYQVTCEGKKIPLTPTEFKILKLLSSRKGWVFSRREILDYLWEEEKFVLDRTVDVHIRNLRAKLGKAAKFIKSIRGVGYRIEE